MSEVNKIPEGWRETTLGEVASIQSGSTPSTKNDLYWNGNIPWITPKDLSNHNSVFIKNGERSITELGLKNSSAQVLPKYSILFTSRAPIGYIAIAEDEVTTNQGFKNVICNEKESHYKYFYYLLQDKTEFIEKHSSGSTFSEASSSLMKSIEIVIPTLPEQKSIAAILTAFDDKIELLQAQNKTLEETAQTIFKEWFGKYQIGDELPEGWRVEELGNLLELIIDYRGKTPLKLGLDWSETGIPAISAKSIKNGKIVRRDAMNFGSEELYSIWMKDELKKGDILLTSEAPLGEMYYINNHTKYILSQRVFALRTNLEITSEYLFHYLFSTNGQALLQARASGSTVEGIRQSELRKIDVIVPKKDILDSASKIFKSFFDKIFTNEQQIQSLTQTRDELLPKLMSGEVRVNEFK